MDATATDLLTAWAAYTAELGTPIVAIVVGAVAVVLGVGAFVAVGVQMPKPACLGLFAAFLLTFGFGWGAYDKDSAGEEAARGDLEAAVAEHLEGSFDLAAIAPMDIDDNDAAHLRALDRDGLTHDVTITFPADPAPLVADADVPTQQMSVTVAP